MDIYKVNNIDANMRLDAFLSKNIPSVSRSYFVTLINEGNVLVNDKTSKPSLKVKENDVISVNIPEAKPLEINKEDIPLHIVYEDEDILIINKPQGMVVHPSVGHYEHTLVNAILNHCQNLSGINGKMRPGIVHRIDKDTSGLICVAKNDEAHHFLSAQLVDHSMKRKYIALVRGVIKENHGTINMPIGRDKYDRQKLAVSRNNSKQAITNFNVLERYKNHTLVECSLLTGRTHQIRVHFSHIGYPIEGDPLYGGRNYDKYYSNGQLLTAVSLTLVHPRTKEKMEFHIDLPPYFLKIIEEVRN